MLDTRGINVWCAAGKGTFSTEELVDRVRFVAARRAAVAPPPHRAAARRDRRRGARGAPAGALRASCTAPCGRADIPAFLAAGMRATPEMREPTFTLRERLVLAPVELVAMLKPTAWVALGALALAARVHAPARARRGRARRAA